MQTANKTAIKVANKRNQVAAPQRKQKVKVVPNARPQPSAQLFKAPAVKLSPNNVAAKGHMGEKGIPRSSHSMARHVAAPRVDNNLKKKSPWYQSIQNPAQGAGIKIPDDVAIETGTLQMCLEQTFNANGNGIGGLRTVSLLPNQNTGSGVYGANYQLTNASSSTISVEWGAGALGATDGFATTPPLVAYAQGVRVVSAAIYCESEASLTGTAGELVLGFNGYNVSGAIPSLAGGLSMAAYRNNYGTSIMPLNTCQPMKVLWTPFNKDQQTYSSFYQPNLAKLGQLDDSCPYWELFVLCNGCPANTAFRVRLIVNYEFIPRENVIDIISANPSPVDSTDVDLTEAWVAESPVTKPVSAKEMSANPGAQIMEAMPQDGGDTGFGMFFEVLKELVPFAIEGATLLL